MTGIPGIVPALPCPATRSEKRQVEVPQYRSLQCFIGGQQAGPQPLGQGDVGGVGQEVLAQPSDRVD